MQTSSWLLGALAALATRDANAANAVFMATSQCSSIDTCFEGGASSTPCSISSGGCPPCITFADDGCYVKVNGACPFGVDCASTWASSTPTSTSSSTSAPSSGTPDSSSTTTSNAPGPSTTSASELNPTTNPNANTSTDTSSSSSRASDSSKGSNPEAGDSGGGGSDMSVVFAIIGAAIGVIAVAVIFLTLVRRSKAAHDEDDDEIPNTPVTFNKGQGPQSTTGAAMYASYNNGNHSVGPNPGTEPGVATTAMNYYNQQPLHNSSAPSPRVAGRAIPSQPVGLIQSTSRPFGNSQNVATPGVGFASGMTSSSVGGLTQAQPTPGPQFPVNGVAPSPHNRRESYEF